jgi:hypothetical protein
MDFIKKHYEKILLGVVLVGLAGVAAYLLVMIPSERESLKEASEHILEQPVKPLTSLDLSTPSNLLGRLEAPLVPDFSSTNKLFNPVPWVKAADGHLIKNETGDKIGPQAVVVTNITPLYLIITLDDVRVSDSGARYMIGVEKEAAPTPAQRRKKQYYASLNEKNDTFTLSGVQGASENPTLVLRLNDTGESATLAKDRPFKRADGYMADLKYDPEKKVWPSQRVGATLSLGGDIYALKGINQVATNQFEVVLSARSNDKKTVRPYSSGP